MLATVAALVARVVAAPSTLSAHPMPQSMVFLDLQTHGINAELLLPLIELEVGFKHRLLPDAASSVALYHDTLIAYVRAHVGARSPDGRAWTIDVGDLGLGTGDKAKEVVVHLRLTPPPGASPRHLILSYDVIQDYLITHKALVSVRSDWNMGNVARTPEVLGTMGYEATSLRIDRPDGRALSGFASVLRLGMRHIAEGTDHLLFLLVLLLPACLLARDGRWAEAVGARQSLLRLLRIVTAFTIGHSITLALGALGVFRAPSQVVEVLIAISILVSAVHALRPLFPGREGIIAGAFGLVHGMAFAAVIGEFGLDRWHTALSILAFNVGIELMQLLVVVVTVPWLILMSKTRSYRALRIPGAALAGVAAVGWIGERALGWTNVVGPWVERTAAHPLLVLSVLILVASGATLFERMHSHRSPLPVIQ